MNYAYINNGVVGTVISEFDDNFPNIPLTQRYSKDFLDNCVQCPAETSVGMLYENGVFSEPPVVESTAPPVIYPTPVEDLRNYAMQRINGKCSSTIYSGVTVGDKHYRLTPTAQGNLKTALDKITSGAASVIYAADNEEPTLHTAAQITAINNAAYEWGIVNTTYYGKLQKWIARETDTEALASIDYGSQLPTDLMQELTDLLTSAGIDIKKYSGLFT